jgi:hypothetical protein
MSQLSQKTPQRPEEAIELIGQMVAMMGRFIRERDWQNYEWFAGQCKGVLIASEQLVEEQGGSDEVH